MFSTADGAVSCAFASTDAGCISLIVTINQKGQTRRLMNASREQVKSNHEVHLPIVLVHGTCGKSEDWSHVIGILSKYRTVIRPDYGARIPEEVHLNGPSISDFAAGVVAEIRDAGIQHFDLVGASLGAAIAICIAAENPGMVNSVVLQSGFSLGSDPRMKLLFSVWLRLAPTDKIAFTKLILASGFSREFLSAFDEPTLEGITESFVASSDWQRIEQAIRADLTVDVREQAKSIKVPTLMITATHDQIVPPDYSQELAGLIPGASRVELDSGHLLFLEKPLDLATSILAFYGTPQEG
jgi:3-oxoadipate enol-lactonase